MTLMMPMVSALAEETFPEYHFTADDCVREQPAGAIKTFKREGGNLKAYLGGVAENIQNGLKLDVVFADDGKTVWFHNLISTAQDCFVWTKGELKGNKIVIPQGTAMWFYDYGSYTTTYVLCNLKRNPAAESTAQDGYECIPGDIEFSYENGELKLMPNSSGISAIGLQRYSTDSFIIEYGLNYKWLGYGDVNSSYSLFEDTPSEAPVNPEAAQRYAFTYKTQPGGVTCGHLVDVIKQNKHFFVKGLSQIFGKDYWASADTNGNNVTFPAKQYLGIDKDGYDDFFLYLCSATMMSNDEYLWMEFADNTTFNLDEATGIMTSDNTLMMNRGCDEVLVGDFWTDMRLAPYTETSARPMNPSLGSYYEYDEYMQQCRIAVGIPCVDVNGNFIEPANLSFKVYLNGEPYTFEPSDYYYFDLPEAMTEIPYGFSSYEINMYSPGMWTIDFYGEEPQSIGVQSVSKAGGKTMMSDIVTYSITGIDEVKEPADILLEKYYNPSGMPVDDDYTGLVIKRIEYTDGSVKNIKIIKH